MSGHRDHSSRTVLLAVWVSFLLFGAIAAPVPGVNEPHYLCKAKHFWQPDWCAQDFFLASPNAHTVFYATIGCLTNVFSFALSAWIGRALATLVLAWGWVRCFSCIFLTRWACLWCAWLFLAITACGNFSGEWLVGGVEGKVICYGLLFAALGDALQRRWRLAATWAGLAVSFHPVVGVWSLLAFTFSKLIQHYQTSRRATRAANASKLDADESQGLLIQGSPTHRARKLYFFDPKTILPFLILFVLSLPGLIPVVRLLMEPVSADTRYAGNYIQVYFRLAHHLDPMMFPARAYVGYFCLITVWLCGFKWGGRTNSKKQFDQIVAWTVVFAVAGILAGIGPRPPKLMPYFAERMNLLKFYPFRVADLLVPIAVAASVVGILERTALHRSKTSVQLMSFPPAHLFVLFIFIAGLWRAYLTSESNRYSTTDRTDWLDICTWIDTHLPADAVVQSPTNGWAFKWFAQRAEFVSFKDCPQDSAGIVEWNRRLNFLQNWYEQKYGDGLYSVGELQELRQVTGLTHLLTDRLGPLELEPIYRNGTFQVYDLSSLDH